MNTKNGNNFTELQLFPILSGYTICQWSWANLDTNSVTQYYHLSRNIQHLLKESRNGFIPVFHGTFLFAFYDMLSQTITTGSDQ